MSTVPSKTPDQLHGRAAAALTSAAMGAAFLTLGIVGSQTPAYLLAACHALVTFIAVVAPRYLDTERVEQLIAAGATVTVSVGTLVVPALLLPIIPLCFFAGVMIGAGLRSRAHAMTWVLVASVGYVLAVWLRPRAGLVLDDWGPIGTVLLYMVPPAMFAGYLSRMRSIVGDFRHDISVHQVMEAKLARSNRELEIARARAIASNEAKGTFLANMSHELRTPLNAIIGYSEMILEEAEGADEQTRSDLVRIRSAGKHLLSLVSAVLDISKIESGRMELDPHEFSLHTLIDEIRAVATPLASANGNRFEVDVRQEVDAAFGDSTKLRQVLLNLLSNACKFTKDGSVKLIVNPGSAEVAADWLVFVVEDDGIGMSEADLKAVFRPFTQADASTTRKYGGTGLGLSLSREFCNLMGGTIEVDSEKGRGSVFTVRIPRRVGMPSAPHANKPWGERSAAPILVVDDDDDARELVRRSMESTGFALNEAADGQEALAILARDGATLIFLDLDMPTMDGYEVLDEIEANDDLSCIPIIAITGIPVTAAMTKRLQGRVAEVVQKGEWSREKLLYAVERHTRRAELDCVSEAIRREELA